MVTVAIEKKEYARLRKLDKTFGELFVYFSHLYEIVEARKEVKEKKTIPQEKLFKKLGL